MRVALNFKVVDSNKLDSYTGFSWPSRKRECWGRRGARVCAQVGEGSNTSLCRNHRSATTRNSVREESYTSHSLARVANPGSRGMLY